MEPLSFFEQENSFKFYLLDCGSGLMHLLIFPDDTVVLFDCNVTIEKENELLNFLNRCIPAKYDDNKKEYVKEIDIFINSHRDTDHLRGLKKINERFKIKSIWDSGQTGANTDNDDYNYYMYLRRELKKENEKNLFVPKPSNIELCDIGGVKIFCLSAEEDFEENYINDVRMEAKIQHTNSMVLLLKYAGRKMLLTGDSDWKSWKEKIVPSFSKYNDYYEDTDILIASHHGSRSFFTDESNEHINEEENPETTYSKSIELIKPVITLISCGDYSEYNHPNKEAMQLYKKYTSNEQVYTTNNLGTISGIINEDGYFAVAPNRFHTIKTNHPGGFNIICNKVTGESHIPIYSGEYIPVGCNLQFKISSWGNIINNQDRIFIDWEVSNSGKGKDYIHQEIYNKGNDEKTERINFSRELCYYGTHLLRCRVWNLSKKFDETKIFVVNGI